DAADFGAFLELLPAEQDGLRLRHVVEVRHDSFRSAEFIGLLRQFGVPVVYADHASYPGIADVVGDFVYARLQKGLDTIETAYPPAALDSWAQPARLRAAGGTPDDLPLVAPRAPARKYRDVFLYILPGGKLRAPAAAMATIERLG